jgi:hypothetical protein
MISKHITAPVSVLAGNDDAGLVGVLAGRMAKFTRDPNHLEAITKLPSEVSACDQRRLLS